MHTLFQNRCPNDLSRRFLSVVESNASLSIHAIDILMAQVEDVIKEVQRQTRALAVSEFEDAARENTVLATIDQRIDKEEAPIGKSAGETEKYLCIICMASNRKVVFMPCSHFVTCKSCSESCDDCPVCRNILMGKLEVFL